MNKLVLQVPSRITLFRTQSNEDESPFDIVIYNNSKKNIEKLELLVESGGDIVVSVNKNRENTANSSGTFSLKSNGRRFYNPEVEVLESAKSISTLKVILLVDKRKIIEKQMLVQIWEGF